MRELPSGKVCGQPGTCVSLSNSIQDTPLVMLSLIGGYILIVLSHYFVHG